MLTKKAREVEVQEKQKCQFIKLPFYLIKKNKNKTKPID